MKYLIILLLPLYSFGQCSCEAPETIKKYGYKWYREDKLPTKIEYKTREVVKHDTIITVKTKVKIVRDTIRMVKTEPVLAGIGSIIPDLNRYKKEEPLPHLVFSAYSNDNTIKSLLPYVNLKEKAENNGLNK